MANETMLNSDVANANATVLNTAVNSNATVLNTDIVSSVEIQKGTVLCDDYTVNGKLDIPTGEADLYLCTKKRQTYLQNAEYGKAQELFAKCGYFKDAKNKVQEVERKRKEVILQSLGLEANSLEDIYTLGNVIPCGLVKYTVSYDNLLNADSDNLVDKTEDSLTYGNYFLYGYLCNIKYYFDANKLLSKIEVISPYGQDKRRFGYTDMTEITDEIQDKLNMEPDLYVNPNANYDCDVYRFEFATNEGIRYEFVSNDIGPLEEDSCQGISKRFRLTIIAM